MPRPVRCTLLIGKLGTAKPFWRLTERRTLCTRRHKAAFGEAGLQKLPKVKVLDAEFAEEKDTTEKTQTR